MCDKQGTNDNMDPCGLRCIVDNPCLKVIAYAVAAEHYVIEVYKIASIFSAGV